MSRKMITFSICFIWLISCRPVTPTPPPDAYGKFRCVERTANASPPSSPPVQANEQGKGTPEPPFLTKPLCPKGQVPVADPAKSINEAGQYVPKGNPLIGPVNGTSEQFFEAQSDQSKLIIQNLRSPQDLYQKGPGSSRQEIVAGESVGPNSPKGNPLIGPVDRASEQFFNAPADQREAIIRSLRSQQELYTQGLSTTNLQTPPCNGIPYYGSCYYYASASYARDADGGGVTMTIERPAYDGSGGLGHTLDEISVQGGANNGNIVEIGWNVSTTQYSNANPHLFIFHWIDWRPTCYDTCGWQQYSSTYFPGMDLGTLAGRNVYAGYVYYQGNWWAWFDNQWLGYFPGSEWEGKYTQNKMIQWFGEVATANGVPPHTDMGNGFFSVNSGAARNSTLCDVNAADWVCWYRDQQLWFATYSSYYDINRSGFGETRYGGAGE